MAGKKVWDKNNQWTEELDFLKSIINKTELIETTKWGGIIYTLNGKNIIGIGGFKSYLGIWFMNGVFLKDEKKILVAASESTKGLRQWRFNSKEEINEKLVLHYIHEAIENEKKGLVIKPEKKEAMQCDFFDNELQKDVILKSALQKLTPYKQKEYWEYMATAKQEKTKVRRFEKIKSMILDGKGFNDKYR